MGIERALDHYQINMDIIDHPEGWSTITHTQTVTKEPVRPIASIPRKRACCRSCGRRGRLGRTDRLTTRIQRKNEE